MNKTTAQKKKYNREAVYRYRQRKKLAKQNIGIPPDLQTRRTGPSPKYLSTDNNHIIPSESRPLPIRRSGRGSANNAHNDAIKNLHIGLMN